LLADFFNENNIKMGRDKLYALLRVHNLLIKRSKRRAITTNSNHPFYKYPNLVKDFVPVKPNELWVSDITYVLLPGKFAYYKYDHRCLFQKDCWLVPTGKPAVKRPIGSTENGIRSF
jgi:hypothetical protein